MGRLHWYKRDPNAALEGMANLTLEERGAYNTILDLIYGHDGAIEDDLRFIAGWCRCDVRVWRRIRQRLLDLGKIYLVGTTLRNERADREVDATLHRIAVAANAGLISVATRADDRRIFKQLVPTPVQRTVQLPTTTKKSLSSSYLTAPSETAGRSTAFQGKRPADLSRAEIDIAINLRKTNVERKCH